MVKENKEKACRGKVEKEKICINLLKEHLDRFRNISEETTIPVSSLIRKAMAYSLFNWDKERK